MQSLNDALIAHLYWTYIHGYHPEGDPFCWTWVFSPEWWGEILKLHDKEGRALIHIAPDPDFEKVFLMGYRMAIRDGAGPPHLEELHG